MKSGKSVSGARWNPSQIQGKKSRIPRTIPRKYRALFPVALTLRVGHAIGETRFLMFDTQASVSRQTGGVERRSSDRFPIEREVRYRILSKRSNGEAEEGIGTTVNISSNGVLFTTDQILMPGK